MTGKLEGKVAIITGASAGIREATAIALASVGATVVLAARRGDRIQALTKRIEASGGKAYSQYFLSGWSDSAGGRRCL